MKPTVHTGSVHIHHATRSQVRSLCEAHAKMDERNGQVAWTIPGWMFVMMAAAQPDGTPAELEGMEPAPRD